MRRSRKVVRVKNPVQFGRVKAAIEAGAVKDGALGPGEKLTESEALEAAISWVERYTAKGESLITVDKQRIEDIVGEAIQSGVNRNLYSILDKNMRAISKHLAEWLSIDIKLEGDGNGNYVLRAEEKESGRQIRFGIRPCGVEVLGTLGDKLAEEAEFHPMDVN